VTGCKHSRTPRRTLGFLIGRGWSHDGPGGPRNDLSKSRDIRIIDLVRLSQLGRDSKDNIATWTIPGLRRFYIRLGRHLLDKSFVLNSNNIPIYWYSFTSNELYFQV
jgi:hypothetical protein